MGQGSGNWNHVWDICTATYMMLLLQINGICLVSAGQIHTQTGSVGHVSEIWTHPCLHDEKKCMTLIDISANYPYCFVFVLNNVFKL